MAGKSRAALLSGLMAMLAAPAFGQAPLSIAPPPPAQAQPKSNPPAAASKPAAPAPAAKPAAVPPPTAAAPAAAPILPPPGTAAGSARPGGTLALDANQRSLVDRVSLYLSTIQTLVGDFVQIGPDGTRSEGQFYIQKPGRVRFEYEPPNPIDITADGRLVSVRNRELDTQDLFPLSQTPLRFLLSDRIDLMRETNIVGVYADDVFATIMIEEKQPMVGTSRLMMMFDAKDLQLKQWTVTDAQGFDTTVAVSNLDTATKPDPRIFTINTARKDDK